MSRTVEEVKLIHRYSESLKRKIVEEIESGELTVSDAMDLYGIQHRRTINRWVQNLGKNRRPTQIVRVMMKSEQERIKELEKALADAELERFALKTLVSVYEEDWGADKKKRSSEQSKKVAELRKKIGLA